MTEKKKIELQKLNVGIVMPIAPIDGCSAEHWIEIKSIIVEAVNSIQEYDCQTKIVSEGDSSGLIHKRIVEGLYSSDIVICDVSCKNPNVMFELGMRLAFDKPTVVIKDDLTGYSFDTGVIEHLEYPRDLRFSKIIEFKERLAAKVKATYEEAQRDPEHSPFLKTFGKFTVATIEETPVSSDTFIIELLKDMQKDIEFLKFSKNSSSKTKSTLSRLNDQDFKITIENLTKVAWAKLSNNNPEKAVGINELYMRVIDALDLKPTHKETEAITDTIRAFLDKNNFDYQDTLYFV